MLPAIWLVVIASGGTRHPGDALGEWQGSASWVVGGEKDKAQEKTGLVWPDSRAQSRP